MKFKFIWIGKTKDPHFSRIEDKYLRRIGNSFSTDRTAVPDLRKVDPRQQVAQLEREARSIESKLFPGAYLIVLDDGGEQFTSAELALFLEDLMNQGVSGITFVAGGYLGVPSRIQDLANLKWSLTKLTLPHEMARVILLEQVYRAISIVKGSPYHH